MSTQGELTTMLPASESGPTPSYVTTGKAGFWSSVFNLMNAILGAGIVGLPYGLNNLGYISFSVSLIIVAAIALFAINVLLILCEKENTSSYVELSEIAFGKIGKFYVSSVIIVHCLIALCGFMFIVKLEGPSFLRGLMGIGLCDYTGWSSINVRKKLSKSSILRFERGTNSIFDPKIVENIDFAVLE